MDWFYTYTFKSLVLQISFDKVFGPHKTTLNTVWEGIMIEFGMIRGTTILGNLHMKMLVYPPVN